MDRNNNEPYPYFDSDSDGLANCIDYPDSKTLCERSERREPVCTIEALTCEISSASGRCSSGKCSDGFTCIPEDPACE